MNFEVALSIGIILRLPTQMAYLRIMQEVKFWEDVVRIVSYANSIVRVRNLT
jgi:hypothetical protein